MNRSSQFIIGTITGAAGILGTKSNYQFQRDLQIAEQRLKEQRKIVKTKIGQIVYGSQGDGTPVLVIHGAGGGFDQALHVAGMFGQGFQWIAPSRFGYLGTPLPNEASPEAQADAHVALLDALEIERAPIIGLSAGGPSSLYFALRYPERCTGLVMVSAISKAMIDVASNSEVMEKLLNYFLANDWLIWLGMQLAIHKIIAPMGVPMQVIKSLDKQDTKWLQELLKDILPVQPRRSGLINDFSQVYKLDIFPADQISAPTLIIHAQDDSLVSIKQGRFSAKLIPHAKLVELPRGGHLLLGQREGVNSEVQSFLKRVTSEM